MSDEYDPRAIKRAASIVRANAWTELGRSLTLDSLTPHRTDWKVVEKIGEEATDRANRSLQNLIELHLIPPTKSFKVK